MDVETDVSVHSKADHSTSFPPQAQTQPQTKPQTPQHSESSGVMSGLSNWATMGR